MYEQLIARLRGPYDTRFDSFVMKQAADVIEELQAKYEKALTDLVKLAGSVEKENKCTKS